MPLSSGMGGHLHRDRHETIVVFAQMALDQGLNLFSGCHL